MHSCVQIGCSAVWLAGVCSRVIGDSRAIRRLYGGGTRHILDQSHRRIADAGVGGLAFDIDGNAIDRRPCRDSKIISRTAKIVTDRKISERYRRYW